MQAHCHIFPIFTNLLAETPARAVLRELEIQCRMLEDDLWHHHVPLSHEGFSILRFGQFIRAVKDGQRMCFVDEIPPDHIEFYKTTIARLIDANELPLSAADQFDHTFLIAA